MNLLWLFGSFRQEANRDKARHDDHNDLSQGIKGTKIDQNDIDDVAAMTAGNALLRKIVRQSGIDRMRCDIEQD
ncbi:Uncharacterised protein [Vibrio cholerae]|uniref:Uncharacterized protein n=1 Tax=Vibrio cholerae TaxID=666 RepID=A0A655UKR7_VIBCL|nr:Uncharacterised protein [Vibrio cholerae]CSB38213.1 Uncharacterised protein [Vibrio cholerae]CSB39952.1 Uncharacterised protein [Vibrio cholerae]CSB39991.1 Uncharacterised protein [Vibrio cholerae]CSB40694.1 Uncharacterised protein [Vibrio cholerae]